MEFKSDTEKLGNVIQQIVERLEKLETANKRSKQTRKFKTLMPCSPDHLLRDRPDRRSRQRQSSMYNQSQIQKPRTIDNRNNQRYQGNGRVPPQ